MSTQASKDELRLGCWLVVLCLAGIVIYFIDFINDLPAGSNCIVSANTYGTRDLDKTYEALDKAQRVGDQFGVAELLQSEAAILIAEDTHGLVIDSDIFKHFFPYREVRLLEGPYVGKALWLKKYALRLATPTQQPSAQQPSNVNNSPCRDPHARRGPTTGVCFCEPGWKTDPTTLDCVPK